MIALVCHCGREVENCHLSSAWMKSVVYFLVLRISNTVFYSRQFTVQGSEYQKRLGLKPEHIESDSTRMMIRIVQGKGRKDRYTVLSERLLCELREYGKKYSPKQWFFPSQKPNSDITSSRASQTMYAAKKKPE